MLPAEFYYTNKDEGLTFTSEPQGELDVDKLIKGQPCWKVQNFLHTPQKKTLIVADWRASHWSSYQCLNSIRVTKELMKEGFRLYVWQDGEFVALRSEKDQIDDWFVRQKMTPILVDKVLKKASRQLGIAADRIHVLDDYWMDWVKTREEPLPPRRLFANDFRDIMQVSEKVTSVLDILMQSKPALSELVLNEISVSAISAFKKMQKLLPALSYTTIYQRLNVSSSVIDELLAYKHIQRDNIEFKIADLDTLSVCVLSGSEDISENWYELIRPHYKTLSLTGLPPPPENFLQTINFTALAHLSLIKTKIEKDDIRHLLSTPTLDILEYSSDEPVERFTQGLPPSEIGHIYLNSTVLDENDFHWFLSSKIKALGLTRSTILDNPFPENLEFSHLEILDVSGSNISLHNLHQILSTSGNLGILTTRCIRYEANESWPPLNLPFLLSWDLSYSELPVEIIRCILNGTRVLETLDLTKLSPTSEPIFTGVDFPFLEKLKLSENILLEDIHYVLENMKQLVSLSFGCNLRLNEPFPLNIACPKLKQLSLAATNISSINLQKILIQIEKLEELNLSGCLYLQENFTAELYLKSLKILDVNNSRLSPHNFFQLIRFAYQLKTLNLSFYECTDGFMQELAFPELEEINLSHCEISEEDQKKILETSSKLRVITFIEAPPAFSDTIKNIKLLSVKKLVIRANTLSNKNLIDLLDALPNLDYLDLGGSINLYYNDTLRERFKEIALVCGLHHGNEVNADADRRLKSYRTIKKKFKWQPQLLGLKKPTQDNFKFHFKGKNKTKNQNMIIEKLSQYMIFNRNFVALIPKIQDGICYALSNLFIKESDEFWNGFVDAISAWNGEFYTLKNTLIEYFDRLIKYVIDYQILNYNHEDPFYLGDNFAMVLDSLPMPAILDNPWHSVGVKKTAEGFWLYDPNMKKGAKLCSREKFLEVISRRLGGHISIVGPKLDINPVIVNAGKFIATGGVLALQISVNRRDILKLLPPSEDISPEYLPGLLLHDVKGKPAWMMALKERAISSYIKSLLLAFLNSDPNALRNLRSSVGEVSDQEYVDAFSAIVELLPYNMAKKTQKIFQKATENNEHFERLFETWSKAKPFSDTPGNYCKKILNKPYKKQLIEIDQTRDVPYLHYLFEKEAIRTSTPFFYADSPSDLSCSAPFVKRQGDEGYISDGPGGDCYDFLMKYKDSPVAPVVLVNYANFSPENIVHFNNLLDDCASADGTPIGKSRIVGLINPDNPDSYQGEDFYSRFDEVSLCPFKNKKLVESVPELPIVEIDAKNCEIIDLLNAENWEERLLGHWKVKKDILVFETGLLEDALAKNKPIHIHNGLWENPKFIHFWRLALLRGFIHHAGRQIVVPQSLQLAKGSGYDLELLTSQTFCYEELTDRAYVLNPSLLGQFFTQYHCDNFLKTLETNPGILAAHQDSRLVINVTRSIAEQEWLIFLHKCREKNIELHCYFAPGVKVPALLQDTPVRPCPDNLETSFDHTQILTSEDLDVTLSEFTAKNSDWMIIDVSECKPGSLLKSFSGKLNKKKLCFEFYEKESILLKALAARKKVILTGKFHPELVDHLAPVLLSRKITRDAPGELVILTASPELFNYVDVSYHSVSTEYKRQILEADFSPDELETLSPEIMETECLSRLDAILRHRRRYPDAPCHLAWEGMESLPDKVSLSSFNAENSEAIAANFVQLRLEKVLKVLNTSPYALLTGLTAVGKTTFVQTILHNDETSNLYQGEQQLKAWAEDTSLKRKILFIDEANMANRNWSEFEGLFQDPPTILIDGQYYTLTPEHKVVFALNPANYGNGRNLPTLFQRHGNAVLCDIMPLEYIYETQLKPVFQGTCLEKCTLDICQAVMAVYQFVLECSEQELLISPRELQMMVLFILSHPEKEKDPIELAKFYAITLARPLVPNKYLPQFDEKFRPVVIRENAPAESLSKEGFINTPERENIKNLIEDFLRLRQFKQENAVNDFQAYGGLGGLILEGEPGVGKTELVRHCVNKLNVPFYTLPVSMRLADKVKLLLKAFDEGGIVLIDEINSSPMLERLLNDLLMGKSPEGARPSKPGFMIIGTQNPVTMAGRQKPAVALARRFLTVNVPNYTISEMHLILNSKGLAADVTEKLVGAYSKQKKIAERSGFKPIPTFRDLLRAAQNILDTQVKMEKLMSDKISQKNKFWSSGVPLDAGSSSSGVKTEPRPSGSVDRI
ncbi:MAG: AAA family ATPase [Legionella sp.]|nr:AAA family ATPase [Legionella sp.]